MIITELTGTVEPDQWVTLQQSFHTTLADLPDEIDRSFLMQDQSEKTIWHILTVWKSREALQAYRARVATPEGILMFRAAGTEPGLSIYTAIEDSQRE